MNNISKLDIEKCNGCSACCNICPQKAIGMVNNDEGFLYPIINKEKCNNCGLCAKVCSVLSVRYENIVKPNCYAFMANDKIRSKSTSGGAFSILARYFINNEGVVCGAVWDDKMRVVHILSSSSDDIDKMRHSKYIQSDINNCYKQIKDILEKGKKVLFTGTPCQVSGLKNFLQKDYNNLFCVDIVCHGVPSQKVFEKYIFELISEKEKWINTLFRDKRNGWNNNHICSTETTKREYSMPRVNDNFLKSFLNDLSLRKSCGQCVHNKIPRQGDMTIGDFWGINEYNDMYNDGKGTSLVLSNNTKGDFLINILEKDAVLFEKVLLEIAINGNPALIKSTQLHKKRDLFFKQLDEISLEENNRQILDDKCDCMLTNLWRTVNYGAVLTCFGVKCLCESFGLRTKVIDYVLDNEPMYKYEGSFTEKFAEKYLNLTKRCQDYNDLLELNKSCKCFVTGSDQIFANWIMSDYHSARSGPSYYLLNFVENAAKKISYAGSFGTETYNASLEDKIIFKHYISQFDAVSVREDSGKKILKDVFDIDSTHLLDGAFHIPMDVLESMINSYKKQEKYIAYFGLPKFNKEDWQKPLLESISKKLNIPVKYMPFDRNISVEEWLAFIKNADFVVSNSYHMIVFSIIFNVPFLQVVQATNTQTRFASLFKKLEIKNKSVYKLDMVDLDLNKFLEPIDWKNVNSLIAGEIVYARNWFKKALDMPIKSNVQVDTLNYLLNKQYFKKSPSEKKKKLFMFEKKELGKKTQIKIRVIGVKISFKL